MSHRGNLNKLVCSLYKTVMGAFVDLIVNVVIVEVVKYVVLTGTEIVVVFALDFTNSAGFSVVLMCCGILV